MLVSRRRGVCGERAGAGRRTGSGFGHGGQNDYRLLLVSVGTGPSPRHPFHPRGLI